ncbi:hypothetical protein SAY86_005363 [Trapa natans]|uniref:Protein kinase domain-containing protein n=1 Tax=Trapa natans TaxID=22666 RepID=A0AAN7QUR9_TRANT|nr:hypothetical protein SAY86_005363 [Trapa natans]
MIPVAADRDQASEPVQTERLIPFPSPNGMKFRAVISTLLLLLFVISMFPLLRADLNSDREALLQFISSVPHARKLNWNSTLPICSSWVGVTCDLSSNRVISVRLPGLGLYGPLPVDTLGKLGALRVLSLRSNYLSGDLPSDVPSIPSLRYLFLQHNNFSGTIPTSLSPNLRVLDLSSNSFAGGLPEIEVPRLKLLNLSYNNFTGSIPLSLRKFPNSSFLGNYLLCGEPLTECSNESQQVPVKVPHSSDTVISPKNKLGTGTVVALTAAGFAVISLLGFMIYICCIKKKGGKGVNLKLKATNGGNVTSKDFGSGVQEPEKNKLFFFEGCSYNFDLEDLLRASAEVLGKGSYGTAYKAIMDDGTTMVVKRLREVVAGKREFEQQMELVGSVGRHPNVVPVRAYYYSKDEKLLVFEYMTEGSLFANLHGAKNAARAPLNWDTRLKVALGTAKGIAHIHSEGGARCLHGNIKSANIFLTKSHEGSVSDFGLAPLMNFSAAIARTIGYHSPETIETKKVTQKSDVYSFGVILLEMLTGKVPLQHSGYGDATDLPRWVRSVVREEWTAEVFDVELLRLQSCEEEMVQMLQIALACVSKVPDARPNMEEVIKMIEDIKGSETKDRPTSQTESNIQTP